MACRGGGDFVSGGSVRRAAGGRHAAALRLVRVRQVEGVLMLCPIPQGRMCSTPNLVVAGGSAHAVYRLHAVHGTQRYARSFGLACMCGGEL